MLREHGDECRRHWFNTRYKIQDTASTKGVKKPRLEARARLPQILIKFNMLVVKNRRDEKVPHCFRFWLFSVVPWEDDGKAFFLSFYKMDGMVILVLLRHTELAMALWRPVFSKLRTLRPAAGFSVLCMSEIAELGIVSWKVNSSSRRQMSLQSKRMRYVRLLYGSLLPRFLNNYQ